jgi:hypothetical protein
MFYNNLRIDECLHSSQKKFMSKSGSADPRAIELRSAWYLLLIAVQVCLLIFNYITRASDGGLLTVVAFRVCG